MWKRFLRWGGAFLIVFGLSGPALTGVAQEAGLVALTQPGPGAILIGVVALNGTATHPSFVRYELAFALDNDPTNTWFSVQEPVNAPIVAGALGSWDTRGIADGNYALRVRVYVSERNFVEAVVRGLRVQNTSPTATPLAPLPTSPSGPTATPAPTVTAVVIAAVPTRLAQSAPNPLPSALTPVLGLTTAQAGGAFWNGVRLSMIFFGILGLYTLGRWWWRRFTQS